MKRRQRIAALAAAAALMLTVAGCSQIAAIAPVGGDHLAEVRFATNDLLVQAEVDLLTAPACTTEPDGAIMCEGETLAGEKITVESTAEDPGSLTVSVGTDVLYSGSIQKVLEKSIGPAA